MKEEIAIDDPMYTNKHVQAIGGWSWYLTLLLLIIGWVVTMTYMWIENEFSFWPLAFFIAAVLNGHSIGKALIKNGYLTASARKAVLDAQTAKDREDA